MKIKEISVSIFIISTHHAIITRAPSLPRTPRSSGFGLDALPLRFERKPSIPCLPFEGAVVFFSARLLHEPDSSNTICIPPPPTDALLVPTLALRGFDGPASMVAVRMGGASFVPLDFLSPPILIDGEPELGEPFEDLAGFGVALIEMAEDFVSVLLNVEADRALSPQHFISDSVDPLSRPIQISHKNRPSNHPGRWVHAHGRSIIKRLE
jgi:hypothetical protein